jgi:SAM-dependent MidA family methyltransferase
MELALYCPNCGYYEREKDKIGRRGDYYTSVSVGSLFGELLAFQFAEWLQNLPNPYREGGSGRGDEPVTILEAGAHNGALAQDILRWMREHRPGLFERLEYRVAEPSEVRRRWQRRNLENFGERVHWVRDLAAPLDKPSKHTTPPAAFQGIIFANEFLDALPVHRLGWDAKARTWFEWGVTRQGERFAWARLRDRSPEHHPRAFPLESPVLDVLPDGFTVEYCPVAEQWWRTAAKALVRGKLVAIDYGLTAEELLAPERKEGTLRACYQHHASGDVLASPGDQDLTAHVNFSAIRATGESAGLKTEAFQTQAQFLTAVAASAWKGEGSFGPWTPERTRQFQTLTHPEHLGDRFRVLRQSRL